MDIIRQNRVLLVGARKKIMQPLAALLQEEGYQVSWTQDVPNACVDYNGDDFDLVAFGRGIRPAERRRLGATFQLQNPHILLIDGQAPVPSLLAKQIQYSFNQPAPLTVSMNEPPQKGLHFSLPDASHLQVTFYSLNLFFKSCETILYSAAARAGIHHISIPTHLKKKWGQHFVSIETNRRELSIYAL